MTLLLNRQRCHALLLILVPVCVFANSLPHDFVWDDTIYLVGNPAYTSFDLKRLLTSLANSVEYLPVRDLSYSIDYYLWGESSLAFHTTNLLLYILVCWAVYLTTLRLAADLFACKEAPSTALTVALLFCVHPLHVEAVAFITSRNTLLAALFFFLSLFLYLVHVSGQRALLSYSGSLLCFLLAAYAKAISLILPLILLLFVISSSSRKNLWSYLRLAPFALIASGTFWLFRSIAIHSRMIDANRFGTSWQTHIATTLEIPYFYLGKLLVPINLAALYKVPFSSTVTDFPFILAAAGLVMVVLAGIRLRPNHKPAVVLLLAFFILLLPVLHLFPTSPIVADRYFFLPSYAAIYLLVYAVQHCPWLTQRNMIASFFVVGSFWSILSWQQNKVWKSNLTLWQQATTAQPAVASSWEQLGREYFVQGKYADAFASFDQVRRINPTDPNYDFFSGYLCYVKGDTACAINSLTSALKSNNQFIEALDLLGDLYASHGEWHKATDCFQRVIASTQVDPGMYKSKAGEKLRAIGKLSLTGGTSRP